MENVVDNIWNKCEGESKKVIRMWKYCNVEL
jgi:hypothetical protein